MHLRTKIALPIAQLLVTAIALTGCSDDDASRLVGPETEPYIARMEVQLVGGVADPLLEQLTIVTGYSPDGFEDCLCTLVLNTTDEGRLRIINQDFYAGFPDFVSRLCNGEDEDLFVSAHHAAGTQAVSALESHWLQSRQDSSLQPDLGDTVISRVDAWIEPIETDSPGVDPNGDGNWTDYAVRITYTFY